MATAEGAPAFSLNQIAVFVTVADTGTIAGAAERLHLSPSAVSAALTELEADARGSDTGVSGVVRLGCSPWFSPTVLPGLMSGFTRDHPDATLEVLEAPPDQLTGALTEGALDLAITYDLELPPSWQRAPFAQLAPQVVLPADHPLADGVTSVTHDGGAAQDWSTAPGEVVVVRPDGLVMARGRASELVGLGQRLQGRGTPGVPPTETTQYDACEQVWLILSDALDTTDDREGLLAQLAFVLGAEVGPEKLRAALDEIAPREEPTPLTDVTATR